MKIDLLECSNFRNYEQMSISFAPGINILYGDNAQGKTNILEALYLSCTSKSHRCRKDREMIRFGQEEAHIRTLTEKDGVQNRIDIHLKKNKPKGIAVNGIPVKKASDLFGIANAVFFSPEDLQMIKNGPAERRRFLDVELCQIDRIYLSSLTSYHRALMQRNQLLKDISFQPELLDTLDIWDSQLVRYGAEVIRRRRDFLREISGITENIHDRLTGGKERMRLTYEPDLQEEEFEEKLLRGRESDLRTKATQCGPHRDDFGFMIGEMDVRRYGSQGQQRTAALSLKIAELELVKARIGDEPVLFLDDVLSELDHSRRAEIFRTMEGVQTVITCTGLDEFVENRFPMDRVYEVKEAAVHLRSQA